MADARIYEALRHAGVSFYSQFPDPIGVKWPSNLFDADLLNRAIDKASKLGPLSEPRKIISELKPVEPNDLGAMDFYRWAFELFGLRCRPIAGNQRRREAGLPWRRAAAKKLRDEEKISIMESSDPLIPTDWR